MNFVFGDVPLHGIRFQKPGGMQWTQWIARVIYTIKCSSFTTCSNRPLQKNAAFVILGSFLLLSTSEPG